MNRLQVLRASRGLNMKEAAQALDMPYTTYVNYEKGTREPNSEVLIKFARFYNTSIDYLVGKIETPELVPSSVSSDTGASGTLSDEELEVIRDYRLLDARGRDTVRRCIANQKQYSGKGE